MEQDDSKGRGLPVTWRSNSMSTIAPTQPTTSLVDTAWVPPAESLYRMSLEQYEAMVASASSVDSIGSI